MINIANISDVEEIQSLVNLAYRGDEGWTRETDLVNGDRATIEEIKSYIDSTNSFLFVYKNQAKIVATVLVENKKEFAYIGLLAVNPMVQNKGLGNKMLAFAEIFTVEELKLTKVKMLVVSQRNELISFYERHGYKRTNRVDEYPLDAKVGSPKIHLTVEYLEKVLID